MLELVQIAHCTWWQVVRKAERRLTIRDCLIPPPSNVHCQGLRVHLRARGRKRTGGQSGSALTSSLGASPQEHEESSQLDGWVGGGFMQLGSPKVFKSLSWHRELLLREVALSPSQS